MAKGVNKVILMGNLGRDAEVTYAKSGTAIAKFSLATTRGVKRGDAWEDETSWHRVTLFGKSAENLGQYLTKGKQVYIEGRLQYGSYEKDGAKVYTTDIIADDIQLCGGKGDGGGRSPAEDSGGEAFGGGGGSDDIPFMMKWEV